MYHITMQTKVAQQTYYEIRFIATFTRRIFGIK